MKSLLAFVVFVVLQALLRPAPPPQQTQELSNRFPGVVQTVVLGGFRPFLVQWLWWDLEEAELEGRDHDVMAHLSLLKEVEPANAKAVNYLAHFLVFTVADREPTPSGKLRRIEEALDLLETSEKELPRNLTLPMMRAQILTNPFLWADTRLYSAFAIRHRSSPTAAAIEAWRKAHALAPGSMRVRSGLVDALRLRGLEELLGRREIARGARDLVEAGDLAAALGPESAAGALAIAWSEVGVALRAKDVAGLARALAVLSPVVQRLDSPRVGGNSFEDDLTWALLPLILDEFGESFTDAAPEAVLSLVSGLHNIQGLLEERSAPGHDRQGGGSQVTKRLRELANQLIQQAPQLKERVPKALR